MRTIWKFPIALEDAIDVPMPQSPTLLHVGVQDGVLTLWAVVESEGPKRQHRFYVRGTGHPMGDALGRDHIGTVEDGPFVWHIFDGGEVST